ncbi:Arc family DNA-binding protein [Consotaella aegiceratis]|uniref:Arc family DNA-binding protein n=1 Tax=Consotaella aegiceratis TaxID=3097961 RepID=UPI002F3F4BF5
MAREDLHFRLRIPEDLKASIEAAAEEHHRSMTAEIVARLEKSFASEQELARWAELSEQLLASLRRSQKEHEENLRVWEWMHEQQVGLIAVLEAVAATDGNLSAGLLDAIRKALATRGSAEAGFPRPNDSEGGD